MILASDIIHAILEREGTAYTNRPDDLGGPTCCGITLETYRQVKPDATVATLQALDPGTAAQVYEHVYMRAPKFNEILDQALQGLMVDAAVQHGVVEASKMLQRAAGAVVDGHLGPDSLSLVNAHEPTSLRMLVCGARIRLYGALVTHDPLLAHARAAGFALQADNALGWANRIAPFVEAIT